MQEQLNKRFQSSKRTEDVLKQIQRKLVQVEKFAVINDKQHESIRKMQYQFNDIQRTITKLDKSITILRSRGSANSNSRVKVGKNNIKYKKDKNSTKKGHGTRKQKQSKWGAVKIELALSRQLTLHSQFSLAN